MLNNLLKQFGLKSVEDGLNKGLQLMGDAFRIQSWAIKTNNRECMDECAAIHLEWVHEILDEHEMVRRNLVAALLVGTDPFKQSHDMITALKQKWDPIIKGAVK